MSAPPADVVDRLERLAAHAPGVGLPAPPEPGLSP